MYKSIVGAAALLMASGEALVVAAGADAARGAVSLWPQASRTVAEAMLEKYGPPGTVDADSISWINAGGWKKTTVRRLPREGEGVLEQAIGYDVPQEKRAALAKLDIAMKVNQADKVLSVASESEAANFLAMNLIDEVVRGKRTPEDARAFYQTTLRLSASGKSSPYMQGLLFRR
ncbi:MAG: hypothetical protein PHS14_12500 [Elusimicrobia bacterium]|nr:hypothetical protein [Elusimicrobiota bacterium]